MLKAGSLAVVIWLALATPPALATSLLTGAVRDVHGTPLEGATVTGLGTSGAVLGHIRTDRDGTFALETPTAAASVRIECRYCRTATLAVVPGEPVVALMTRFDALVADGPTSADLVALPYVQIENALALKPFEVRNLRYEPGAAYGPGISDRGLSYSALVLDGAASTYSLYAAGNGLATTPAHGGNAFEFVPSSQAFSYGADATGGIIELSRDGNLVEQAGYGDASTLTLSAGTRALGISFGNDANDILQRERIVANGATSVLGGILDGQLSASRAATYVGYGTAEASQESATMDFARAFGRVRLQFSAADALGTDAGMPGTTTFWNDFTVRGVLGMRVGAFDVQAGSAYTNATGYVPLEYDIAATAPQLTLYLATHLQGPTSIDAGIATTAYKNEYGGQGKSATLPSLVVTQSLGQFAVAAGFSQSLLGTTGNYAGVLASLSEAHLLYSDGNRLRVEIQSYRQTHDNQIEPLSGTGASVEYQVTATTSIRAWSLRLYGDYPQMGEAPYISGDTLCLTNQNGLFRFDLIYKRTANGYWPYLTSPRTLDGDIYFPVTPHATVGFRSVLQTQGRRSSLVLTIAP